jgi:hypothetical protein
MEAEAAALPSSRLHTYRADGSRDGTLKGRGVSEGKREHPIPPFVRPVRPLRATRLVLALDDVVDLEHLGLTRLDPNVLQHRHEALTERVELLPRVPDLTDSELAVRLEGDVVLESLRQPVASIRGSAGPSIGETRKLRVEKTRRLRVLAGTRAASLPRPPKLGGRGAH